jgi:ketosteroid isomerase-like protein
MTSANVQLVRSIYAGWERGDLSSTAWAHPEIEFVIADGLEPGRWTGLSGMAEANRRFLGAWEAFRVEAEECRDLDGERVLVLYQFSARGKKSELDVGQIRTSGAELFHVHSDQVTKLVRYWDRDRALADLGLAPEAGSQVTASANLDLVRSIHAPWERGDFSSTAWAHPEIEYVVVDGPSPGTWTGLTDMARGARADLDAWEGFRYEAEEYRELDGERVLVLTDYSGRGKTSGLELGQMRAKGAHLFHVRDGKITRLVRYWDRDRALADLGLAAEGGASP